MIKRLKNIIIFSIFLLLLNCSNKLIIIEEIDIKINNNEKYYHFKNDLEDTIKFERKIKILQNTISDTIILGQSILKPGYTGFFEYTKLKDRNDISLDLRYENPPADRIYIKSYNNKKSNGILVIELIEVK